MKLASLEADHRDGRLIVVDAALERAVAVPDIAQTMNYKTEPLMYQGLSDHFIGPRDPIRIPDEALGLDCEPGGGDRRRRRAHACHGGAGRWPHQADHAAQRLHLARTRQLSAGTIIGAGAVANKRSACSARLKS